MKFIRIVAIAFLAMACTPRNYLDAVVFEDGFPYDITNGESSVGVIESYRGLLLVDAGFFIHGTDTLIKIRFAISQNHIEGGYYVVFVQMNVDIVITYNFGTDDEIVCRQIGNQVTGVVRVIWKAERTISLEFELETSEDCHIDIVEGVLISDIPRMYLPTD